MELDEIENDGTFGIKEYVWDTKVNPPFRYTTEFGVISIEEQKSTIVSYNNINKWFNRIWKRKRPVCRLRKLIRKGTKRRGRCL